MRRGLRFVPPVLVLTAAVEIVVFVLVARRIGFGGAVLLTMAMSVLGVALLRREGVRAWRGFQAEVSAGQPPGERVTDGLLGLLAGLLLAVPGVVTGVAGLLLVVPPVRSVARRLVRSVAERRISSAAAGDLFGPRRVRAWRGGASADAAGPPPSGPPPAGPVAPSGGPAAIEGEIVEPRHG